MSRQGHLTMIGGGYVGLVSGVCMAAFGAIVHIVEHDPCRLARLKEGNLPIYEPGLATLFAEQTAAGRIFVTDHLAEALAQAEAVFIAVGTPTRRGSGHADLRYVYQAARTIAETAPHDLMVVTKSTVPVGTGQEVAQILAQYRPERDFSVASNPEFLREGHAIDDFMTPDRVIIGLDHIRPRKAAMMRDFMNRLYSPVPEEKRIFMGLESAELTKYAANAFLAMKVSFANEMADLCEVTQADIAEVTHGMGLDPRIGPHFLRPGPGYGGSCFPKDTQALAITARNKGRPNALVEAIISANNRRKQLIAGRILDVLGTTGDLSASDRPVLAILGLTFKAGTDDMREAPALTILPLLQEAGTRLQVFDPQGMEQARQLLAGPDLLFAGTVRSALKQADMAVILTEWDEFRHLTPQDFLVTMRGKTVFDCRNLYNGTKMKEAGLVYHCLGKTACTS